MDMESEGWHHEHREHGQRDGVVGYGLDSGVCRL